jgi:Domain of unknown function (DUF5753)
LLVVGVGQPGRVATGSERVFLGLAERWTQVITIAREAGEKGWWESTRGMGERQALYANLEAGAAQIREYQQTFIPGLLQIPDFARARTEADATLEPLTGTVEGVLAGNGGRQRMLRRPGAPGYEVILDEMAIRRLAAPPEVVKKQLYHLATTRNSRPGIAVRVLPVDARVDSFTVPRCTFSIYTYPDPPFPAARPAEPTMAPGGPRGCTLDSAPRVNRTRHQRGPSVAVRGKPAVTPTVLAAGRRPLCVHGHRNAATYSATR